MHCELFNFAKIVTRAFLLIVNAVNNPLICEARELQSFTSEAHAAINIGNCFDADGSH